MIYFIQAGENGPIKIGFAKSDAEQRRRVLQTSHYETLRILACIAGTLADECALHRKFAATRIRGEWFGATDKLLRFIAAQPRVDSAPSDAYRPVPREVWLTGARNARLPMSTTLGFPMAYGMNTEPLSAPLAAF